jgi:predicted transcriptional regulator
LKNGRLGELEFAIMDYVWKQDRPITVPEVHEHLLKKRHLAYTSTMTVMSRLHEKGLLGRSEDRRPYTYWAALSREDYSAELMVGVLAELGNRKAALARFVERMGRRDAETLRQLVLEARRRRR